MTEAQLCIEYMCEAHMAVVDAARAWAESGYGNCITETALLDAVRALDGGAQ
ncbi:MAG: hypothetical protein M3N43_06535 [Actinomycetota bacterium]|nr:hypothetical protein [Actinomycetota bacterium]